ncbi:MAG: tetratricopeptide repeat protein [Desulfosalsimonas sp.]
MGNYESALSGYTAALEKWPKMESAMMGRANSLYSLGRIEEAADMLNQAAAIHTESGPVLNNLACVMLELGELEAAFDAATRAVKVAGPHAEACRKTLESVREAMDDKAVR